MEMPFSHGGSLCIMGVKIDGCLFFFFFFNFFNFIFIFFFLS